MYLILITISLLLSYFVVGAIFSLLFIEKFPTFPSKAFVSMFVIFVSSLCSYMIVSFIPHAQVANWVLHGLGGGFLAFLVCFLVVRDIVLPISRFQFFIVAMLLVGTLGITNEILEFLLQNYAGMTFALSVNDTWYDLISNTMGALVAAFVLVPFFKTGQS